MGDRHLHVGTRRRLGGGFWFEYSKETHWRLSERPVVARAAGAAVKRRGWLQGGDLTVVEQAVTRRR